MKLKVLMIIMGVLAAGAAPASASILDNLQQWLLPDVEVYLEEPQGGGSWTQCLIIRSTDLTAESFSIGCSKPSGQQIEKIEIQHKQNKYELTFKLGQYLESGWTLDTPSFVLTIEGLGHLIFISPAAGLPGYGWLCSGPGLQYWSQTKSFPILAQGAVFTGDACVLLDRALTGQGQGGIIPEPGSALVWALLALCGGAATVLYRRRRAA